MLTRSTVLKVKEESEKSSITDILNDTSKA
jgi:hypothetical protein